MKYIIEARYKKLHNISVHVNAILSSCKRGRSDSFAPTLKALQNELEDLEALKSPPFNKEQILQVEEIEKDSRELLLLPEGMEKVGAQVLKQAEVLLKSIDPFTYSLDDTIGVRKAQLVEFSKELQIYLQAHILHLEGKATSMIDEKIIIEDITADIGRVDKKQLKSDEKSIVEQILESNINYQKKPNLDSAKKYLFTAQAAENLFRGTKGSYKTLNELNQYLIKVYQTADKEMTSEKESFSKFTTPLRTASVINAISRLKALKLKTKELTAARDNILFAYENGAAETGDTFISRCRAIDFYKLFGHELDDFDDLLRESPDKDIKIN